MSKDLIEKFNKTFGYPGFLEFYKQEGSKNPAVLITDPSNICGIVYTEKLLKHMKVDSGWDTYFYNGFKPSKKDSNYVYFNHKFYQFNFIETLFNKFFKGEDVFDIRTCGIPDTDYHIILVKIDATFSIGIACVMYNNIREDRGGVLFIKTEYGDDLEDIEKSRHFVEWKGGIATFEDTWRSTKFKRVVYSQEHLFDIMEEEGDSLLI